MPNKDINKESDKEGEEKQKVFFANNDLTITENYVCYKNADVGKRIYLRNVAGTSFYNARVERTMSIFTFVIGIACIYFYARYELIYILITSILFSIGGIIGFILSKDKLTIHSNASTLSISYKLGMKEQIEEVQKTLDDAVKYSKRH
jgi:hypothetical protein